MIVDVTSCGDQLGIAINHEKIVDVTNCNDQIGILP